MMAPYRRAQQKNHTAEDRSVSSFVSKELGDTPARVIIMVGRQPLESYGAKHRINISVDIRAEKTESRTMLRAQSEQHFIAARW